jgi:hypothetical protein
MRNNNHTSFLEKRPLGRTLLLYILVVSSIITLLGTAFELGVEYIAIPKQNVTLTVFLKAQMAELINAAF